MTALWKQRDVLQNPLMRKDENGNRNEISDASRHVTNQVNAVKQDHCKTEAA